MCRPCDSITHPAVYANVNRAGLAADHRPTAPADSPLACTSGARPASRLAGGVECPPPRCPAGTAYSSVPGKSRSPATARTYRLALCQFRDYLAAQGLPTAPQHIAPAHVDAYLAHMKASGKAPATVKVYGAALRAWFAWLVEQGEVPATTTLTTRCPSGRAGRRRRGA